MLVLAVEFLVMTITAGTAIANKIRAPKSQALLIEDKRFTTTGNKSNDKIKIIFSLVDTVCSLSYTDLFSTICKDSVLKISINATELIIIETNLKINVTLVKDCKLIFPDIR